MAPPPPPPIPPNYNPIYPQMEAKLIARGYKVSKIRNTFTKPLGYLDQEAPKYQHLGPDVHHFAAERAMWLYYCKFCCFPCSKKQG
jgi:hypothetical protein